MGADISFRHDKEPGGEYTYSFGDLHLSNTNTSMILNELALDPRFEEGELIPLPNFIARCLLFLEDNKLPGCLTRFMRHPPNPTPETREYIGEQWLQEAQVAAERGAKEVYFA